LSPHGSERTGTDPDAPIDGCGRDVIDELGDGWLGRAPTIDEQEVVAWIASRRLPHRMLHIGIGTNYVRQRFGDRVIQGITKDGGEARSAELSGLDTILCNKYDTRRYYQLLDPPFDCVIDVNIRSYACCDVHFRQYMELMRTSLSANGVLVTSRRGLHYLQPTSIDELKKLCPEWTVKQKGNIVALYPGHDLKTRILALFRTVIPLRG
jgi:hypothetical protein